MIGSTLLFMTCYVTGAGVDYDPKQQATVRKYVFILLRADTLLSLIAFVAGIAIKIFNSVVISDMLLLTQGRIQGRVIGVK